jgi:glycerol-3-phosphate acyltransferase PlsY
MLHIADWSVAWPHAAAALVIGYALGSIPFGLILTRLAGTTDIRSIGSGSIGATNVLRTGRKGLAAATMLFDILKGTAAVLIVAALWGREAAMLAGFGAFLGHLFPIWLRFKGGKGVATFLGLLIALAWPAAIGFGIVWLTIAGLTRYSSLSSLTASAAAPAIAWFCGYHVEAVLFVLVAVLIFIMHRANIARLAAGAESKIGQSARP